MRNATWVGAALLLFSCPGDVRLCTTSADCLGFGQCSDGVCVIAGTGGSGGGSAGGSSTGGGTAGGSSGGGSAGGSTANCVPDCPASSQCIASNTCAPRYAALTWLRPAANEVVYENAVALRAELAVSAGRTRNDPLQLPYTLTAPGGAMVSGTLVLADAGVYGATENVSASGGYQLTVSFTDAGLGPVTQSFTADFSPPSFVVQIASAPTRRSTAELSELDPSLPAGSAVPYFRRDELARIAIRASTATDPASIVVEAAMSNQADGGSSLPYFTMPAATVPCGAGVCGDAGYCECRDLDLSKPPFPTGVGTLALRVSGKRPTSTVATQQVGVVGVTRWKWREQLHPPSDAGFGHVADPAIDAQGNIIVRVSGFECSGSPTCGAPAIISAFAAGGLRSLSPAGDLRWATTLPSAAAILAAPSVGSGTIFSPQMPVLAVDARDGGLRQITCPSPDGGVLNQFVASPVVQTATGVYLRTRVSAGAAGTSDLLMDIRPGSNPECVTTVRPPLDNSIGLFSGAAGDGNSIWIDQHGRSTQGLGAFGTTLLSNANGLGFTYSSSIDNVDDFFTTNEILPLGGLNYIGLTGFHLQGYGAPDSGVVYRASAAGIPWRYPQIGQLGSALGGVVTSDGTSYVLFHDGETGQLARVSNTGVGSLTPVDSRASPLLGKGGLMFLPVDGGISVRPLDGGAPWPIAIPNTSAGFISSPNIDCSRDSAGAPVPGRPGVLYVVKSTRNLGPFRDAQLYAIIVDSAGIDTTALWPKALHDPRNTNNSATSLSEFACP